MNFLATAKTVRELTGKPISQQLFGIIALRQPSHQSLCCVDLD
jgi:hypothetical protein